jgi:hypothetical protein
VSLTATLKRELTPANAALIAKKIIALAAGGDTTTAKLVFDRIGGRGDGVHVGVAVSQSTVIAAYPVQTVVHLHTLDNSMAVGPPPEGAIIVHEPQRATEQAGADGVKEPIAFPKQSEPPAAPT